MKRTKCPPHTTLTTPRRTADRHLLPTCTRIVLLTTLTGINIHSDRIYWLACSKLFRPRGSAGFVKCLALPNHLAVSRPGLGALRVLVAGAHGFSTAAGGRCSEDEEASGVFLKAVYELLFTVSILPKEGSHSTLHQAHSQVSYMLARQMRALTLRGRHPRALSPSLFLTLWSPGQLPPSSNASTLPLATGKMASSSPFCCYC
jgi:hypothetical protein